MFVSDSIRWIGVNDHKIDLFEGQYVVPEGMSYNSYLILDEKIAVMDTVDIRFRHEWLDSLQNALGDGRKPDYLIVQHMEPDHSANIAAFLQLYPEAIVVSSEKAFAMMQNFFGTDYADRSLAVGDGDTLTLGKHVLTFRTAPMVHWPEVIVAYDSTDKVLFSADGFGKFGAVDTPSGGPDGDWACEARRYYFGIVGKYGAQVQALLKKASELDIRTICPLHGPVLNENLGYYLGLYDLWSSYGVESEGIVIAYTSVYGHTKQAVELLEGELRARGCPKVVLHDLARCDQSEAVEDAFRYGTLVLATTTYNAEVFPFMHTFLTTLAEHNYRNRTIALIENGSWAPLAAKGMRDLLAPCKNLTFASHTVRILSSLSEENREGLRAMADELCQTYLARQEETANKQDPTAFYRIGYGLYVVTCNDGKKDNGLIVNTVSQVADSPNRIAVTINKQNYSHHVIQQTGVLNVNCLTVDAPFRTFETFGFQSGRTADKFAGIEELRSANGLRFLPRDINALLSLRVEQYVDLGSHGMFLCSVTESRVLSSAESMTYAYYQANVKPKPQTEGKKGYVCTVCGYVYEGDELPEDYICPLCKHGASDFEPIK